MNALMEYVNPARGVVKVGVVPQVVHVNPHTLVAVKCAYRSIVLSSNWNMTW